MGEAWGVKKRKLDRGLESSNNTKWRRMVQEMRLSTNLVIWGLGFWIWSKGILVFRTRLETLDVRIWIYNLTIHFLIF